MTVIETIEALEEVYADPGEASLVKEANWITPEYRALIEASPFVALEPAGRKGWIVLPVVTRLALSECMTNAR